MISHLIRIQLLFFLSLNHNIKVSISRAYRPIKKLTLSTMTNSKPFIKTKQKPLYNDLK